MATRTTTRKAPKSQPRAKADASKPKTSESSQDRNDSSDVPTGPYIDGTASGEDAGVAGLSAAPATNQGERIQHIAAKLFADRGYRGIGVAELCEAVGLGRGALYYHINSKEELLFNIVVRYIEDLVIFGQGALVRETDPRQRIRRLSRYLMRVIAQNLPEMTVCFREADALTGQRHKVVSDLHQQYQDVWLRTFKDGESQGLFKTLPAVAIKGILGMYFYSFLWFKSNGRHSPDEVAEIFADMVLAIVEKKT
ncbi:TetR/AcrR family transcriptional regulator [Methylopila henanensis]|uniref:TetR/AcrR family transcriptional regulator n=1 Tax=Methylopila henanensis TaxID=873516 RepID=A0ABW4KEX9_9HYPH